MQGIVVNAQMGRFRMSSGMAQGIVVMRQWMILDAQPNHVLSCHCFRFFLLFFRSLLGYLKDGNVAAYSVDSDILYKVINVSACSKSYIVTFTS